MRFWEIQNNAEAGKPASLRIAGNMGRWNDVDERYFVAELEAVKAPELDVYVASNGGSVQTGLVIYNALRRYAARGTLRTHADGIVASAATLPFLAGDERIAPVGTLLMVHQALTPWAEGNADDLREAADILEKVTNSIADVYAARTGMTQADALALMKANTWMTAAEAVEKGFATQTTDAGNAKACLEGDVLNVGGQRFELSALPQLSASALAYVLQNSKQKQPTTLSTTVRAAIKDEVTNVQRAAAGGKTEGEGPKMDLEKLKAEHKDVHDAVMKAGQDAGAQAERARILAIQDATPPGFEADAAEAIKNGASAAEFALAVLAKQKQAGANWLQNRQQDAEGEGGANGVNGEDGKDKEAQAQAKQKEAAGVMAAAFGAKRGVQVQ